MSQTIERTTEDTLRFERDMARIQRDKVLAALKRITVAYDPAPCTAKRDAERWNARQNAHAVIDEAEGVQLICAMCGYDIRDDDRPVCCECNYKELVP